jgi:tRNA (guanine37-N1)-methyltransferase
MGDPASAEAESFARGLLDFPHYTRPENIDGQAVPPVLLSGDHARIAEWRLRAAILRTALRRPDLLAQALSQPEISRRWAEISAELPVDPSIEA